VIDVSKFSAVGDFMILATSESSPQTRAISDAIEKDLMDLGYKTPNWQGKPESNWIILDLGNIIVHIMGLEERKKYSLEEIWEKSGITFHI
jgi:ribosome-associated protein